MLSRMLRNRMAGRLEGTHTFLHNHRPEARTHHRFLDQVDLTTEQRGEPPTQSLQSAKMVEPPDETPLQTRVWAPRTKL
jgi:hypothetical protein